MGGSGALVAGICGFVAAFLVGFKRADASWIDVVLAAVCCAVDEGYAVEVGNERHNVEGRESVD